MPLINVIRGEQLPHSTFNVRTPILRIPLWAVVGWQLIKALAFLLVVACRYWYVTGPAAGLLWLYAEWGWYGPAGLILAIAATATAWGLWHRPSFLRFGCYPLLARHRRWIYR